MGNNAFLIVLVVIVGGFAAVWFGSSSVGSADEEIKIYEEKTENKKKLQELKSKYNKALKAKERALSTSNSDFPQIPSLKKLSPEAVNEIKSGAKEILEAVPKSNVKAVMDRMYPGLFIAFETSRNEFSEILKKSMSVYNECENYEFKIGNPGKLHKAGASIICLVPVEINAKLSGGQKIKTTGAMFAVNDYITKRWTFFDSNGVSEYPELLWKMFPLLSKDFEIPKTVVEEI